MKWISIGQTCIPRFNIEHFISSDEPTHIFDWMISNFGTVLSILQLPRDEDALRTFFSKLTKDDLFYIDPFYSEHEKIEHTDEVFVSIHDLDESDELSKLTDRLVRRFLRLIEYIKNNDIVFVWFEDKAFFNSKHIARQVLPTPALIERFFSVVESIGSNTYSLILVPQTPLPSIQHDQVLVYPTTDYARECEPDTDEH